MSSPEEDRAPATRWCLDVVWQALDLLSDLHLQVGTESSTQALEQHLTSSPADAFAILGDLFEVWVGDDAAEAESFEADLLRRLRTAARGRTVAFMPGNRDFLLGPAAAARGGFIRLADPCVLDAWGHKIVLTHGDALCLADQPYQAFRAQVRSTPWQAAWLARPMPERRALAAAMRAQSRARPLEAMDVDVDESAASALLARAGARTLIHGHTHRPACHMLDAQRQRWVLSDWDAAAQPPRGDVLRITRQGIERLAPAVP